VRVSIQVELWESIGQNLILTVVTIEFVIAELQNKIFSKPHCKQLVLFSPYRSLLRGCSIYTRGKNV
jgi:hypothetical protein